MSPYFEIKDLILNHKTFQGEHSVLDIGHIQIERGSTYGIVGESGAGKTVLALIILGLLQCPPGKIISGQIILDGIDLLGLSKKQMQDTIRGKKVAMIFQDPMSSLNPVFTVGYQIKEVIKKHQKINDKEAYQKALEIINTVQLADAENILQKYPHQLSGGQRQRVIIAMALVCGAEFIIADEPTRNLDVTIQASILKTLKDLQEKFKVTILFIANNFSLISVFCDNVGILHKGRIIEQGTVGQVLNNPQEDYTKLLIESATKNRTKEIVESGKKEVLLEVKGLKKYFPVSKGFFNREKSFVRAVDGVDLVANRGEVIGIVGESGCGKSTLVNTILNLNKPTFGEVIFDGVRLFQLDKRNLKKARKSIQIVFQDPYWSLNPRWLVKDLISEPIKVHEKLDAKSLLMRVEELLELVGLPKESAFKYAHEFSGGQRQRIAIARALAVNPKLIVLDEPTSSVDVFSQFQILHLLNDLRKRFQLTNILISHDLSVVNYMANKIIIMYLGIIVECGVAKEVFNNPLHPYTQLLFNSIPDLNKKGVRSLSTIEGNVPSAINPPGGCRFHPRCPQMREKCKTDMPQMLEIEEDHFVACNLFSGQAD